MSDSLWGNCELHACSGARIPADGRKVGGVFFALTPLPIGMLDGVLATPKASLCVATKCRFLGKQAVPSA
jgi:hypothetical protein